MELLGGYLLWLFTAIASYFAVVSLALSVAIGLYYVAELAEEYTTLSGKIIKYATMMVMSLHVLMMLDGLPMYNTMVGLVCHACYYSLLKSFPFINTLSLEALLSIVAFIVSHVVWFQYFTGTVYTYGSSIMRHDFVSVLGFFFVMLWMVPIGLFVSISVNDNVLPGNGPSMASSNGMNGSGGGSRNIFKTLFDYIQQKAMPLFESGGTISKFSKDIFNKFDKKM